MYAFKLSRMLVHGFIHICCDDNRAPGIASITAIYLESCQQLGVLAVQSQAYWHRRSRPIPGGRASILGSCGGWIFRVGAGFKLLQGASTQPAS